MKRVCAWCGVKLPDILAAGRDSHEISHGLCVACYKHMLVQIGLPLNEYLNVLGLPVVAFDRNVRLITANDYACELLGKEVREVKGLLGGNVFECQHAEDPAGCGQTIHCNGCAIRRSVTSTFETGESHVRIPACLNRATDPEPRTTHLLVSTERAGAMVLLRLDAVDGCDLDVRACGMRINAAS